MQNWAENNSYIRGKTPFFIQEKHPFWSKKSAFSERNKVILKLIYQKTGKLMVAFKKKSLLKSPVLYAPIL